MDWGQIEARLAKLVRRLEAGLKLLSLRRLADTPLCSGAVRRSLAADITACACPVAAFTLCCVCDLTLPFRDGSPPHNMIFWCPTSCSSRTAPVIAVLTQTLVGPTLPGLAAMLSHNPFPPCRFAAGGADRADS